MKVLENPGRSQVYMVMEWVDGRLLREILTEEGVLPTARAIRITSEHLRRARLHSRRRAWCIAI